MVGFNVVATLKLDKGPVSTALLSSIPIEVVWSADGDASPGVYC